MIKTFNSIEVNFETNEIIIMTENNSNTRTKVEPRIMHVLQILMKNSPKVVPRELIISEVWDNYGGADEALNQAISHLRKLLNDSNKENRIIETVVKKGYRFNGENNIISDKRREFPQGWNLSRFWIIILFIGLLLVAFISYTIMFKNSNAPEAPVGRKTNITTPAPDVEY